MSLWLYIYHARFLYKMVNQNCKEKKFYFPLILPVDVDKCIKVIKFPVSLHARAWYFNQPSNKRTMVSRLLPRTSWLRISSLTHAPNLTNAWSQPLLLYIRTHAVIHCGCLGVKYYCFIYVCSQLYIVDAFVPSIIAIYTYKRSYSLWMPLFQALLIYIFEHPVIHCGCLGVKHY